MKTFYETLAPYWPLISPVDDYEEEMREVQRLIEAHAPASLTMLELGSGGGHNAYYLKQRWAMTLTDLNDAMLDESRRLNPECEHVLGDMRTLELSRTFDVVFAHDAIDYMTTEDDLESALRTARRHLKPGGLFVCVPDHVEERFEPGTDCGGSDGDDGRSIRFLEWTLPQASSATSGLTLYSFVTREPDGTTRTYLEEHTFGLFPEATWIRLLERSGFSVEVVDEGGVEDERTPRRVFLARARAS